MASPDIEDRPERADGTVNLERTVLQADRETPDRGGHPGSQGGSGEPGSDGEPGKGIFHLNVCVGGGVGERFDF